MKLLTRDGFKTSVFYRDKGTCVFCEDPAHSAHHILDRKLFPDGGYYVDNGIAVCEKHHWACETTIITVEAARLAGGITELVLPPDFDLYLIYDKWGNVINADGTRTPGPLFFDDGCRRALTIGGRLGSFVFTPAGA